MPANTKPDATIAVVPCPNDHPVSSNFDLSRHAENIASQLHLPLAGAEVEDLSLQYDFALQVCVKDGDDYYLALKDLHSKTHPISINFSEGKLAHRRLFGGGRKQPLARAVGMKPGFTPVIVDTTAGLARDAFVLACLGCRVIMIERSPILAILVADGLRRASNDIDIADIVQNRMQLIQGDAKDIIKHDLNCEFDVAYLDPMYPTRTKSALVKKEMRMLRNLIGSDMDAPELLNTARECARQRVVVKRPRLASPLAGSAPEFQIESKSTRYDVYLTTGSQQ